MYTKEFILEEVNVIRDEIGHEKVKISIEDIYFENNELWIITEDRPDKSAIIGKGGWVVGKLKEKLGLSEEEVMQIVRCGRGQGLLCAGKNRIAVEIRSSQTQYDLITTNRADLEKREKRGES